MQKSVRDCFLTLFAAQLCGTVFACSRHWICADTVTFVAMLCCMCVVTCVDPERRFTVVNRWLRRKDVPKLPHKYAHRAFAHRSLAHAYTNWQLELTHAFAHVLPRCCFSERFAGRPRHVSCFSMDAISRPRAVTTLLLNQACKCATNGSYCITDVVIACMGQKQVHTRCLRRGSHDCCLYLAHYALLCAASHWLHATNGQHTRRTGERVVCSVCVSMYRKSCSWLKRWMCRGKS